MPKNPYLVLGAIGAGAALVALVVFWRNRALIDPRSDKNLAYQAAGSIVSTVTGGAAAGGEDNVGGVAARIREWWSGDDARIRDMLKGAPPAQPAIELMTDPNNPFMNGA